MERQQFIKWTINTFKTYGNVDNAFYKECKKIQKRQHQQFGFLFFRLNHDTNTFQGFVSFVRLCLRFSVSALWNCLLLYWDLYQVCIQCFFLFSKPKSKLLLTIFNDIPELSVFACSYLKPPIKIVYPKSLAAGLMLPFHPIMMLLLAGH